MYQLVLDELKSLGPLGCGLMCSMPHVGPPRACLVLITPVRVEDRFSSVSFTFRKSLFSFRSFYKGTLGDNPLLGTGGWGSMPTFALSILSSSTSTSCDFPLLVLDLPLRDLSYTCLLLFISTF